MSLAKSDSPIAKSVSDSPSDSSKQITTSDSKISYTQSHSPSTETLFPSKVGKRDSILSKSSQSKSASDSPSGSSRNVTSADSKSQDDSVFASTSDPKLRAEEGSSSVGSPKSSPSKSRNVAPTYGSPTASVRQISSSDSIPPSDSSPFSPQSKILKSKTDILSSSNLSRLPSFAITWTVPAGSTSPANLDVENVVAQYEAPSHSAFTVQFISELPFESQKIYRTEVINAVDQPITEVKLKPVEMDSIINILTEAKPLVTHCLDQSSYLQPEIFSTLAPSPAVEGKVLIECGKTLTQNLLNEIFRPIIYESENVSSLRSERKSEGRVEVIEKVSSIQTDLSPQSKNELKNRTYTRDKRDATIADTSVKSEIKSEIPTDTATNRTESRTLASTSRLGPSTSRYIVSILDKSEIQLSFRDTPSTRSCPLDNDDDYFYRLIMAMSHVKYLREYVAASSMMPVCNDCGFLKSNQKCVHR